jgi:hypothetical protein
MAMQMIAKLLDYTKNVHAEVFNKELGRTNPQLLARFSIEQMLVYDSTKQCAYIIVNQYIKRRQLN